MSMALPAGMLSAQRTAFETSLPRTCTLSTPGTPSVDDYGNTSNTPTTTAAVPCSFMERAAYERMIGGALQATGDVVMYFKASQAVAANMTATVDADVAFSEAAETFQLVGRIGGPPRNYFQVWTATRG